MLLFELELVELQKGVPEGYMFVWTGESPDPLFDALDLNKDKEVPLEEVGTHGRSVRFSCMFFLTIYLTVFRVHQAAG